MIKGSPQARDTCRGCYIKSGTICATPTGLDGIIVVRLVAEPIRSHLR